MLDGDYLPPEHVAFARKMGFNIPQKHAPTTSSFGAPVLYKKQKIEKKQQKQKPAHPVPADASKLIEEVQAPVENP